MSNVIYTNFGNIGQIQPSVVAYVNQAVRDATQNSVQQSGTATVNAVPKYASDNTIQSTNVLIDEFDDLLVGGGVQIGTNAVGTSYFLPLGRQIAGDYNIQFDANGNTNWTPASGGIPSFVNTLTVQNLSQGTSALNQNYTFPTQPPSTGVEQTLIFDNRYINVQATVNDVFAIGSVGLGLARTIGIPVAIYPLSDLLNYLQTRFDVLFPPPNNVLFTNFNSTQISVSSFGNLGNIIVRDPSSTLANYLNFQIGQAQTLLADVPLCIKQNPAVGRFNIVGVQQSIQSTSNISSITCTDTGTGGPVINSIGDVNYNLGNLNEVGSINSTALTLTSSCGQSQLQLASVADGSSSSNTAYLSSGNGVTNAGFATTVGEALIVRDGGTGTVIRVNVGAETILKNAPDRECIRVYDYGVQIKGEGQPLATGVRCAINLDGDIFFNREDPVFGLKEIFLTQGTNTRIWSPSTISEVDIDESYIQLKRSNVEKLKVDNFGTKISQSYYLPTTDGTIGQVMTTDGLGQASWQTPQILGFYSQTTPVTVATTAVQTTIIGAGVGSLSVPANYFTTGMAFTYRTGGLFGALNNATIRFRLTNSGTLFDSGLLQFSPAIASGRPWNIDVTFIYVGGTTMITNFNFQYNNGSDARGFTAQNTNNTFNPAIVNTLDFTAQWGTSSASNTITTNYGILTKIY